MINTHEELLQKIKEYESKWGKLGHTNIMQPELKHTGLKGGSKMLKMDNEYYEFRRKVAEGSKKNRLAHASTISPDELNERYEQELVDRGSLIHAANGMKGQQFQNTKYYKREGEPGHYRYYYTKEEWDAAHANGSAADANREAKARSAYETNKKIENYKNKQNVTNTSSNTRENNLQADFTKKFSDIARQSPEAAAKEIINDENTKIKTFYNKINDGFKKGIIVWKNGRFEIGENASDSDYENIKNEIETYSDQLEKFVKDVDAAAGSGRKTKDAIAKMMTNEIESMYQKAEKGKENLKANQNAREEAIKKSQKAEQDRRAKEEADKQHIEDRQNETLKYKENTNKFKEELEEKKKNNEQKQKDFIDKRDDIVKEFYKANGTDVSIIDAFNETAEKMGINPKPNLYPGLDFSTNDKAIHKKADEIQKWIDKYKKDAEDYSKKAGAAESDSEKWDYYASQAYAKELVANYENQLEDLWAEDNENFYKVFEEVMRNTSINGYEPLNWDEVNIKERERKEKSNIKHHSFKNNNYLSHKQDSSKHSAALITNSNMGNEIMDEYAVFQEKVKAGAERHRLAHSTFISPEELNAKYQEELENNRILCHTSNGQNYGYYQKIEKYYPDGSTRYFYTKEQWDAYQKGLKLQKQAEVHNQQVSNYEKNKAASQHEGDRYNNIAKKDQKTTTPKVMNEQERKQMYEDLSKKAKIHNQQIETIRKNAEAAKHEGDRFIKDAKNVIKDSNKNTPEQPKTPKSEVPKQNNVEEQKKQEAANKEIEKRNTINYITETFNNSDLAENWAQAVAFTDVYGADESAKKILADNNASMDNTVKDVMNQLKEAYGEDAAEEFFNNAHNILQEKYNKYYTMYISEKNATDLANQQMMNQMMFGY